LQTFKFKEPCIKDAMKYALQVTSDEIPACKYVKLACKRQIDDLEKSTSDLYPYYFDEKKAAKVIKFIELLPHTKGKWAFKRETLIMQPWQKFNIACIFGWVKKKDNLRRFTEVYNEIPRKNGKSLTASGVGLYMFALDNEFGAEVYSGATTEKQAWEVFRPARLICKRTPELCQAAGITVNASNMVRAEDGARFEPLIGRPGDGASPSCSIIDEYHEHTTPELYDTMVTGQGSRDQPLNFIITTAGSNIAGPCYDKRAQLIRVLEGTIENEQLFGIIYTIDEDDDWTDISSLIKANPNYGVSVGDEYLQSRLRDALQSPSRQAAFKTKHLNVWVGARNAWMNIQEWGKAPPRKTLDELAGRDCFMALDLASKIDIAAMILLFPPVDGDPLFHVHGKYYLPEDLVEFGATSNSSHYSGWARQDLLTLTPGNIIDFDYIMDDMRDFASKFNVLEVPFDPFQATQLSTQMAAEGLNMVEVGMTVKNLSEPMKQLEVLILSKLIAHGNCPVLTWMASNVTARLDAKDNIFPTKEFTQNKIDGIVSLIMALGRFIVMDSNHNPVILNLWD
jgi:phage terminase large subunit-like protein